MVKVFQINLVKLYLFPENKSDNSFRVKRIIKFATDYFHKKSIPTLLDVGKRVLGY